MPPKRPARIGPTRKGAPTGMLNLGPKSTAWLASIGVHDLDDLKRIGAVPAYLELKRAGINVSLVMLYALEGAVSGRHWLEVKRESKRELLAALQ